MSDSPITGFNRALFRSTNKPARPAGTDKWIACCPAHEDANPSLSISMGNGGRALVHCHAGCSTDAVCKAVGLTLTDLMPSAPSTSTKPPKAPEKRQYRRRRQDKGQGTYDSANAAIEALERQLGKKNAHWTYYDDDRNPVGVIVRWDTSTGKEIRPVARHGERWVIGGMPEPRPLYCLSDLTDASRIYVCEGEKAADAARSVGLTATTSAHGSKSAAKTDWSPLAGKECVIIPDNDDAGQDYADAVATILGGLNPPASIKVIRLPDLPAGGDMADWIELDAGSEPEVLRNKIAVMAEGEVAIEATPLKDRFEKYRPFPTQSLPQPVRGFIEAGAKAIGCDSSFLALPMLSALGAAIGNTRQLRLKRGWEAPAIIWTAIVGESGTAKTPAFKLIMRPIRKLQEQSLELHAEQMRQHEIETQVYEKDLAVWKRDKKTNEPPPAKPIPPEPERMVVSDTTVEALAPLLLSNPRGLLLARDELSGWIGSFDRYAGGSGGADAANWLSMYNGESIIVDRKTGNPKTIYIPQASVCVTGGIQPTILHRALGSEHRESGLAARMLLACPPRQRKKWTEADIDPQEEAKVAQVLDRLYDLRPETGSDDNNCPVVLELTKEAKQIWTAYYNNHANEQVNLSGDLSAAWSKLEEYAARLAIVVHCVRWAVNDPTLANTNLVDATSMAAGVALAEWFKGEARRVYGLLAESDGDRDRRRLIELVQCKGHPVTAREMQQACRWLPTSSDAEKALNELVKDGVGFWQPTPSGKRGKPTRRFELGSVYGNSPKHKENGNTVDVDDLDASVPESDDEWGEI